MSSTARLYHCTRCHCQVLICRRCDRGNRYCNDCKKIARKESLKRAQQKYQSSRKGRLANATRQARFRQRQREKITHHGSVRRGHDAPMPRSPPSSAHQAGLHCHFCGEQCDPFLRQAFLTTQARDGPRQLP